MRQWAQVGGSMYWRFEAHDLKRDRHGLFTLVNDVGIMARMKLPSWEIHEVGLDPQLLNFPRIHWMTREGWEKYGSRSLDRIRNWCLEYGVSLHLLMAEDLPGAVVLRDQALLPLDTHMSREWDSVQLA